MPLALGLIVWRAVRAERAGGLEGRLWDPIAGIVLAMAAGLVLAGLLIEGRAAEATRFLVGAAGTLAIAAVLRDAVEAAAAAGLAGIGVAVLVAAPGSTAPWSGVALAVVLTGAGVAGLARERAAGGRS